MVMKTIFAPLCLVGGLFLLTLVVPAAMWFAGDLTAPSQYSESVASAFVILGVLVWYERTRAFSLFPSLFLWKASCLFGGAVTLVLLVIAVLNEPVSQITGQVRAPFAVINVIVLTPMAEELVFRGVMWSIFERLSTSDRWRGGPIVGTSFLFGIEHLGYWVQSLWPLPLHAVLHSLSMVAAGACFGAFRCFSGSLVVPIIIHMVANGIVLLGQ